MTPNLTIASILFLGLSMISVWMPSKRAWIAPYAGFIVCGLASGWIQPIALLSLCAFALVVRMSMLRLQRWRAFAVNTLVVITAVLAAAHIAPGFSSFTILENTRLSNETGWSSLRFSADKPSIGLFLLLANRDCLCRSFAEFARVLRKSVFAIILGCVSVYFISMQIGFIELDITFSWLILIWFIRNLMFTVIAEEALFRGFLQPRIETALDTRTSPYQAMFITAILFGSVHLYGGWQYGLVATIAGVLYGYVFMKTGRLELAIGAHIALNTGHLLFFSYP